MSQIQDIASRLRALANDASPISSGVQSSAHDLKALSDQAQSLARSGVNANALLSAIQQAYAQATRAADAAAQVRQQGAAWADQLAHGGGGGGGAGLGGTSGGGSGGGSSRSLSEQRDSEPEWVPGSGDGATADLLAVGAHTSPDRWAGMINLPGISAPGRDNNCVDCARSVESTWRGSPTASAAMSDANGTGTGVNRITDWTGGSLEPATWAQIEERLGELGDGSSAIVVSSWADGSGAHAYNAINDGGVVKFVDGQSGVTSSWPPISWNENQICATGAVFINNNGRPA